MKPIKIDGFTEKCPKCGEKVMYTIGTGTMFHGASESYEDWRIIKHDYCPRCGTKIEREEVDIDIHGITDCDFCKHGSEEWDSEACDGCCNENNHFEPKDELQMEYERASEQREHDILYKSTYNKDDGSM